MSCLVCGGLTLLSPTEKRGLVMRTHFLLAIVSLVVLPSLGSIKADAAYVKLLGAVGVRQIMLIHRAAA